MNRSTTRTWYHEKSLYIMLGDSTYIITFWKDISTKRNNTYRDIVMEIKFFSIGKSSPKKDQQHSKSRPLKARNNNNAQRSHHFNAIDREEEKDGVMRVTILVRKEDLEQMLESIGNKRLVVNYNNTDHLQNKSAPTISLEQRIGFLRKKQLLRAREARPRGCPWSPVLQSIPEEFWSWWRTSWFLWVWSWAADIFF